MVLPQKPEEQEEARKQTPTEGKVEVIKVCEFVLVFVWEPVQPSS